PTSASSQNLVVGRLRMHRDGYGFVTPEPDSLPPRARGKLLGDIFIPPPEVGNAMHGDQVLVELGRIRPDGKGEGRILRVTEREHETVVGIFHYGARHNYVKPFDPKIGMEIIIPPGLEYPSAEAEEELRPAPEGRELKNPALSYKDVAQAPSPAQKRGSHEQQEADERDRSTRTRVAQALLPVRKHGAHEKHEVGKHGGHDAPTPRHPRRQTPHRVLGEEAARRRKWDDLENVVVEVEITQFPSATQSARGRVVEILGYEDDFGVDVEIMIRKHHIRHVFPPEVLEEAQEISPVIPRPEIARRRDYRHLPIVTIDGETARDFDDAVLVRRLPGGHYELHVHIADVAQYVEDGSAIDDEARRRGTSVYFPDRAVPMLPIELSTDICSLRPQVDRLVLSCVMEIDRHGEVIGYELAEGIIRSAHRMTYTDVNAIIEGDAHLRSKYSDMVGDFELMYELAQMLNRKRAKRGSIDFDLPEPVIEFDEFGLMKSISPSERNWAHRLIEEFMLAANETVATHLEQRSIASLYRIHEKPDPKRIYEFEQIAASFGYSLGVGALPIKRVTTRADKRSHYGSGRRAPVIELPEEVHVTPRMYQKLVAKITGKPEERVLSYLMLRSLKQARYSEINEGHFALAAPTYTHFTSPIRRYPDLIVHRILKDVLREEDGHMRGRLQSSEEQASPWSKRRDAASHPDRKLPAPLRSGSAGSPHLASRGGHLRGEKEVSSTRLRTIAGLSLETLHDIADSSSQAERAADEAERELMEWKKLKFMENRLGEEFAGLIVNVMKYGFFVELTGLFIEGLVPIDTLEEDHYTYRENTRQILGQHSGKIFSIGDRVRVLADRIDHLQRKIQFALVAEKVQPSRAQKRHRKRR
ncbi:MAG TPA: RNB domain-containing ribonuclease, partial [Candidatus Binataceae bacterium]|nr:RNB domain-containing ribonuclease [Candidatus Binataceae bacterium]